MNVGLAGADMGVAHLLPRMVGLGQASELLLTGEFIDADEALRIGLYNRVVPGERLAEETAALVDRLVRGSGRGPGRHQGGAQRRVAHGRRSRPSTTRRGSRPTS